MIVVVLQPSYIPWRGYFSLIHRADRFVFYDDVQFDKGGWRNRNQILGPQGKQWLTIPVHHKGQPLINEVEIDWTSKWNQKHLKTLRSVYGKAPYFKQYLPFLEEMYARQDQKLSAFTIDTTIRVAELLGITDTEYLRSSDLGVVGEKMDRLVQVLEKVGATHYISGPSAKNYMAPEQLEASGISLEYIEYDAPNYQQMQEGFDPNVSALDLLFMEGPRARELL